MDATCGGCGGNLACGDNTVDYGGSTSSAGAGSTDIH
jgi:hypothetical protein